MFLSHTNNERERDNRESFQYFCLVLKEMKQKMVIKFETKCEKCRKEVMMIAAETSGVDSVELKGESKNEMVVIGDGVDAANLTSSVRKKVKYASLEMLQQI